MESRSYMKDLKKSLQKKWLRMHLNMVTKQFKEHRIQVSIENILLSENLDCWLLKDRMLKKSRMQMKNRDLRMKKTLKKIEKIQIQLLILLLHSK